MICHGLVECLDPLVTYSILPYCIVKYGHLFDFRSVHWCFLEILLTNSINVCNFVTKWGKLLRNLDLLKVAFGDDALSR